MSARPAILRREEEEGRTMLAALVTVGFLMAYAVI